MWSESSIVAQLSVRGTCWWRRSAPARETTWPFEPNTDHGEACFAHADCPAELGTDPIDPSIGDLWSNGPKYFKCSGNHTQNTVECGAVTLPADRSLFGVEYPAQGYCGSSRFSNAIVQKVGF